MTAERTRVLSVVGPGRSGTTILGNILGEVAGIANAGELRWLWRRGLTERRPCGCGRPPAECPRWSAVLGLAGEPWGGPAADGTAAVAGLVRAQDEVLARRNRLRAIAAAAGRPSDWAALGRLRAASTAVLACLAQVTGARLVVDTSKTAETAAVLAGSDRVDHRVLHLVRDPRAVAFSWQRPKPLPLATGLSTMATQRVLNSAGFWAESCLGAELLRRQVPPDRWMFLRYEDFTRAPRASVGAVLDFLGLPAAAAPFVTDDTISLQVNHTLAGNPNRFRTGLVRLAEDDEWRRRMPLRDRAAVSLVTAPFLARYGYPLLPATTSGRGAARPA